MDRSAAIAAGDRDGMLAAAERLRAAGCRYQWARTLVLAGGQERTRGEDELAAMGASPMALGFARIIEHAGLSSTRLISYHFESRDALMREALGYVVERGTAFMRPRIVRAGPARARLAAYIRSNLEFLAEQPAYARAAVEILANLPARAGQREFAGAAVTVLEQLFTVAQEAGEMRRFDPVAMAVSLRAAVDAAATRSVTHPVDLRQYAEELVEIFDRATATEVAP